MNGRIHHLQRRNGLFGESVRLFHRFIAERLHHLFSHILQQTGRTELLFGRIRLKRRGFPDERSHFRRGRRHHLAAETVIDLITVVFFCIMAGRNDNPGGTAQFADGIRKQRRRRGHIKEIGLDAAGRHGPRCFQGEIRRTVTGIIGHGDSAVFQTFLFQPGRKAPGGLAHSVMIHPVRPGPHHAAHTGGTERKIAVKAIFQFGVVIANRFQFRFHFSFGIGEPVLISCEYLISFQFKNLILFRAARAFPFYRPPRRADQRDSPPSANNSWRRLFQRNKSYSQRFPR